jgi:carbonic anhydrase/acetyltransferase-like protein (isoleucine patch superfamily)
MILTHHGKAPVIGQNVFIAPTAVVIGDVVIADNASIWFNAVVRGDLAPIVIGAGTNIQDNCTLHTDLDAPLTIGSQVTVGHNAVVHGCRIEDHVLIGMQAIILNYAHISTGSVVAAGALIKEGQKVESYRLMAGMPAQVKKKLDADTKILIDMSAEHYRELAATYTRSRTDQGFENE